MSDVQDPAQALDRPQLIAELQAFPEDLLRAVQGHTTESLSKPASGGGWSVTEIVCHLLDWEEIFLQRVVQVIESEEPELPAFDGALWDIEHDYRSQDPRAVLSRFTDTRSRFTERLQHLDDFGWERVGGHQLLGSVTVEWLASRVRDHSREHLSQIRDALC